MGNKIGDWLVGGFILTLGFLIWELPDRLEVKFAEIATWFIETFDPLPPMTDSETADEYLDRIDLEKMIRYLRLRIKTYFEVDEKGFWDVIKQYRKKDQKCLIQVKQLIEYVREMDQSWLDRATIRRDMKNGYQD